MLWKIFPTKFCDTFVPGGQWHFGGYSIFKAVISGFLAPFELTKLFQSPGTWIMHQFQIASLKYAEKNAEMWIGNVSPDYLNLEGIFFLN